MAIFADRIRLVRAVFYGSVPNGGRNTRLQPTSGSLASAGVFRNLHSFAEWGPRQAGPSPFVAAVSGPLEVRTARGARPQLGWGPAGPSARARRFALAWRDVLRGAAPPFGLRKLRPYPHASGPAPGECGRRPCETGAPWLSMRTNTGSRAQPGAAAEPRARFCACACAFGSAVGGGGRRRWAVERNPVLRRNRVRGSAPARAPSARRSEVGGRRRWAVGRNSALRRNRVRGSAPARAPAPRVRPRASSLELQAFGCGNA